ncbi:MAG: Wzz/FepE/Etk N-terminal domain-containing protein, partial [Candidatus Sulfotelmatobacter sp.]
MMENRELTMDDYLAMLRRRMKVILIPALLAPLAGFLVSYLFSPKYTSQSLVLVEGQKVPEGIVQPVVTADLTERIATLQQQVLSQSRLQPMLERSG